MQWTYDPSVDALTIIFDTRKRSSRTDEHRSGILIDYDIEGHPISVEVLDASTHFGKRDLLNLPLPQGMIPLSKAAKEVGLDPATLRQQIRRKRLKATKHHREWWIDKTALRTYLDSRAPQGRRSRKGSSVPR